MTTSKQIEKAWISRSAAAKRLGVRRDVIDHLIAQRKLRAVNLNGHMRVTRKSLDKLADDPPPIIRTGIV